jgi:hypothetical protein
MSKLVVLAGTLEFVETFHGYALYGKDPQDNVVFIAEVGDMAPGFDPNGDPELEEAYDFRVVES